MGNILQDMMGLLSRKKVAKKADPNNYIILGRIQGPEGIYAYDPKMENRLITFEEFRTSLNSGTTNFVPLWSDGPKGTLVDSKLEQSPQLSTGLYQMRVNECDRFIINKPSSVTQGDPEYLIQQDKVSKVSIGWDDDGGGFGFIYNWAGLGLKLGAAGNNPMLEIKTTSGQEEIDLHKSIKLVDYGSGSKTDVPAYILGVKSDGKVIETPVEREVPYKVLSQIISQTGTGAPTVDRELQNSTGTTFTWQRFSAGVYRIIAAAPVFNFPFRVQVFLNMGNIQVNADPIFISHSNGSDTLIEINTWDATTLNLADTGLQFAGFEVHIYPV